MCSPWAVFAVIPFFNGTQTGIGSTRVIFISPPRSHALRGNVFMHALRAVGSAVNSTQSVEKTVPTQSVGTRGLGYARNFLSTFAVTFDTPSSTGSDAT